MHRVMHRNPRYSASADCCRHCTEGAQAHHCGSPPCKCNDQSEVPFSIGSMEQNEATAPNSIVVGTIAPWAAAMMFPDPEPPVSCPKTLWTGAGHGHLGLTEWATSRLHLRAAGSRYTEGRCLFTEGQRGGRCHFHGGQETANQSLEVHPGVRRGCSHQARSCSPTVGPAFWVSSEDTPRPYPQQVQRA
jgi:hypothetical protein